MMNKNEGTANIGYTIEQIPGLKSGTNFQIDKGVIKTRNGDGSIAIFESIYADDQTMQFSMQDGTYNLVSFNAYDSQGNRILYIGERAEDALMVDQGIVDDDIILTPVIQAVPFDWENSTLVCGENGNPILPWISGASTGVAREVALDHKSEDGWVMIHHSFKYVNDLIIPSPKYMLLYNRFTGILRMWYWHEGSNSYTLLKYGMQILANTSLMNFHGEFALPMDIQFPCYTKYFSGDFDIPAGQDLTDETWYMFDYEIAYDNDLTDIFLEESDFILSTRGVELTTINLSGTQTGTINGQVSLTAPGANLFNISSFDFDNSVDNTVNNSITVGSSVTSRNPQDWWDQIKNKISESVIDQIGNAGGSLASSILNLATNPATEFLNSLIHQGLQSRGSVQLKLDTQIELSGELTNQNPVFAGNLHIPGIDVETGLEYLYDKPLGVFSISNTPVVKYEMTYYHIGTPNPRYFQYYDLDESSFSININPEIANEITINAQKKDLYFYKRYQGGVKLDEILTGVGPVQVGAQNELIYETDPDIAPPYSSPFYGYEYYKFTEGSVPPVATTSYGLCWEGENISPSHFEYLTVFPPDKRFVVKVTLNFTVNATGRKVTIVKTYLPDYVYDQNIQMEY